MAEDGVEHGRLAAQLAELTRPGVPVVRAVLRPRPLGDVRGRRVAFFGTAPAAQHERIAAHLERSTAPTSLTSRAASPTAPRSGASSPASTRTSSSSRSRPPRSTSSPRRRRGAGSRSCWPANDVVPLAGEADLDARAASGSRPRRSRARWWACERAPLPGAAAARRRRGAAVVEGADGARARRDGPDADAGLRARAPAPTRTWCKRRDGRARPRPAGGDRRRGARRARGGADDAAPAPAAGAAAARAARRSCSSAGRRAPASRRSRPRRRTGSGSRGSPRRTSSGRRCARSSRASSCRPCTTRASRPSWR